MVSTRTKTYASDAKVTRTSRKSFLQEAAEVGVSFNERNEPDVWASEGELPSGNEPEGAHSDSVAHSPARASSPVANGDESDGSSSDSSEIESDASSHFSLRSRASADWNAEDSGFIVPRRTAKRYIWSAADPLTREHKFFPSWFDLSLEDDQLGPIPEEWLTKEEEEQLQEAIKASLADMDRRGTEEHRVHSMAVIVEVLEESSSKKSKSKDADKGKGIGASGRSAAFADYLRKQQEKPARGNYKASKSRKKSKESKASYMRPSSQVPEGGWFRNTMSASGSPPAPPTTPDDSDGSSSSGSSDSLMSSVPR